MLGRDLLVVLVLCMGLDMRQLWIPPGSWHNFFDCKTYSGELSLTSIAKPTALTNRNR
ncbi:MAG: hypothetical protein LBJ41_09705 [Treponema sp.]|nr:hypothetical protein [Treponema sp.]